MTGYDDDDMTGCRIGGPYYEDRFCSPGQTVYIPEFNNADCRVSEDGHDLTWRNHHLWLPRGTRRMNCSGRWVTNNNDGHPNQEECRGHFGHGMRYHCADGV